MVGDRTRRNMEVRVCMDDLGEQITVITEGLLSLHYGKIA